MTRIDSYYHHDSRNSITKTNDNRFIIIIALDILTLTRNAKVKKSFKLAKFSS